SSKHRVQVKFPLLEGQRQGVNLHCPVPNTPVENQLEQCRLCFPFPKRASDNGSIEPLNSTIVFTTKYGPIRRPTQPHQIRRMNMIQTLNLAPRSRKPTEIALVLNKEGQLLCLYCGGKHELDSCVKWIAREAAKLAKKENLVLLRLAKKTTNYPLFL
ncbi:hypothetical protein VP01_11211g1, partial [Puccinia sorghi]